jgi:tyrosine--tRNA ligase
VNKEKVASPDDLITSAQLIADRYLLVQRGKKNYYLVLAK